MMREQSRMNSVSGEESVLEEEASVGKFIL